MANGPPDIPESRCFVLLANRRRRQALDILRGVDSEIPTREVAVRITDRQREPGTAADILCSLHDVHLPALAEANVVSFDPEDGTVGLGPNFGRLVHFLEVMREGEAYWTEASK